MYSKKFVVAAKSNGKILREQDDTVFLPFGSEYSLLLKNLNSVRALVTVEIDGIKATEGISLIIKPNESIDLERFIKDGNMESGQRFKFIERTAKIEEGPRGIRADDGLIRVEVQFEAVQNVYSVFGNYRSIHSPISGQIPFGNPQCGVGGSSNSAIVSQHDGVTCSASANLSNVSISAQACSVPGITVGGSVSQQQFIQGSWFPTEYSKHVLVLKIQGVTNDVPVKEAITVKSKIDCPTCGTKNKGTAKFCDECGTGLIKG